MQRPDALKHALHAMPCVLPEAVRRWHHSPVLRPTAMRRAIEPDGTQLRYRRRSDRVRCIPRRGDDDWLEPSVRQHGSGQGDHFGKDRIASQEEADRRDGWR